LKASPVGSNERRTALFRQAVRFQQNHRPAFSLSIKLLREEERV
jgi:predicted ATPase